MITREDLKEAIAECQGVRHPNARTCIKLAAFLTIQEYMFGEDKDISIQGYSEMAHTEKRGTVSAISDSEFSDAIHGKSLEDVLRVIDDLMKSVEYFNPKLHKATIQKLKQL